ncbi:hypothetical protein NITHO_3810004 [Nitrolancea hollandica Lb]|uniref:Uncharacterized protein n=1 Tax=Nitrolancea hollandica Lb TaxID=1129897 RepID=I4EJ41_9BACT|nr:hypothetical protein NITHO_3810004 [Nitrolancea hollandica Lb]
MLAAQLVSRRSPCCDRLSSCIANVPLHVERDELRLGNPLMELAGHIFQPRRVAWVKRLRTFHTPW